MPERRTSPAPAAAGVGTAEAVIEANPEVVLLAGLSTSPGYPATPAMLFEAFAAVREIAYTPFDRIASAWSTMHAGR